LIEERIVSEILGIIEALVYVALGAIFGYFVSKIQRRSERLIEGIYEPLLGQVGQIEEKIQDGRTVPDLESLEKTRQGGMYFVVDGKTKKKADSVYQELKNYQTMYNASTGAINKIIEEEVGKVLVQLENPERYRDRPYDVDYRAHIVGVHVGNANLRDCLRIGKTPVQFLSETKPRVKDSEIDCLLAGYDIERRLVDPMAKLALGKANEDSVVQETRSLRNSLLRDLQEFSEMLTRKVKG